MLTMQRSTLSFAAIIIFAIIAAIFVVRKGNEAADELERLNSRAFAVHRAALADELGEGVSDISNWKTYRNEKYGFEVKYPLYWEVSFPDFQDIHQRFGSIGNELPSVDLRIVKSSEITEQANSWIVNPTATGKRIIDGTDATEVINDSYKQFPDSLVYFTKDSRGFIFLVYVDADPVSQIFYKMLSTFKFTK